MNYQPVENLQEGHVLAEDVHDINGRLLLSKGQAIAANHLRIFRIWGITEVKVSHPSVARDPGQETIDPLKLAEAQRVVEQMLNRVNRDHPAIQQVIQYAADYRYQHGNTSPSQPPQLPPEDLPRPPKSDALQRTIDRIDVKLPEAPAIVIQLNEVLSDPVASANDVARIVSTSPSLAALILKIVNSAALGLPTKVDRVSRAVTILGTREISSLAMGVSVMQTFGNIPRHLIDMNGFLMHSLACATITRILAALANVDDTEQLFVAGLLHDVGRLVLYKYFPDLARQLLQIVLNGQDVQPLFEIEKSLLGQTHAQIAEHLLKKWNFPSQLRQHIVTHHTPSRAQTPAKAVIIQMADIISHSVGFRGSGEQVIPCFDAQAWDLSGIVPSTIKMAIRQAMHQLLKLDSILL